MWTNTIPRWMIVGAAIASPAAAFVLYWWDPADPAGSLPLCGLYALTGLHCPCCGSTRCGHALLHGDVLQAAAWNPLAVVFYLVVVPWIYWSLLRALRGQSVFFIAVPAWMARLALILLLAFAVVRNLPCWPCDLLAPHKI
jgi:hypothetical protein